MTHLLPFRFFALSAAILLSGCCANNVCDCKDAQADAVQLRFSNAFSVSDLDTILIQRYPLKYTAATKPETVTLIRTVTHARDSILLDNATPFPQLGSARLNRYRYVVQYYVQLPGSKSLATTAYIIDSLHIRGSLEGNGCCTCYTNAEKTIFAKDSVFNLKQKPILKVTK